MFWKIAKLIAEGYVVSLIPHRRNISRIQAAGNLTAVFAAVTHRAVCYITGANFTAKNPCALQHCRRLPADTRAASTTTQTSGRGASLIKWLGLEPKYY